MLKTPTKVPALVLIEGDMCHRYVDGKRTESARIVSDANSKRIKEDIEFFRESGLSLEEEQVSEPVQNH